MLRPLLCFLKHDYPMRNRTYSEEMYLFKRRRLKSLFQPMPWPWLPFLSLSDCSASLRAQVFFRFQTYIQ